MIITDGFLYVESTTSTELEDLQIVIVSSG